MRWVRGDHIELAANDDYFRGKPKLRRIVVRDIPDENTTLNALRSHDVDWMFQASPSTINALRPLEASGSLKITFVEMPQTLRLYMNNTRPDLRDVRVRRAIAYAIDKQALVDRLTGGTAVPGTADQPAFSPYYEPDVARYPHDPAKARTLLRQAGYTFSPDGMATKRGRPLSLQLSYNVENATRRNAAVQIRRCWRRPGIDAPIKPIPPTSCSQPSVRADPHQRQPRSERLGLDRRIDPDDYALYGCDMFPPKGTNYTRYCSIRWSACAARWAAYDPAIRKARTRHPEVAGARSARHRDLQFRMIQPIS